ncbi:oxysterol-binding protein 2-like isoform X1 [Lates japonicus]|uniref:Oxysterol-binding protein 2-like isoform X1 n=1 Tax=Lates japonicus TaxID=270547 RepID=A0AAD3NA05_LATJO|nr:oxysterol-binding protein 2-like isoform X1 [Lates japonicus]GLD67715.1 oxysterol-binding protein 2-like isoform X1 [Lates japonicus]
MAHTCRGTINLATAHIDTEDACNIVLSSGGRTYHLKASTEVERQRWVTALELAKAKAIRMMNDQSDSSESQERAAQSAQSSWKTNWSMLMVP